MGTSSFLGRLLRRPARPQPEPHIAALKEVCFDHHLAIHTGMVISAATHVGRDLVIVLHRPYAPVSFVLLGVTPTSMWSCDALVGGTITAVEGFVSGSVRLRVRTSGELDGTVLVTAVDARYRLN